MPQSVRYAVTMLAILVSASAVAQEVPISADESARAWLVELSSPPAVEGSALATLRAEKDAFRAGARRAGVRYTERFAFDTLWNGISVSADRTQVAALARIPGVKALWPVETLSVPPTTPVLEPELVSALSMTGADVVQAALGLTGAGVKVAIIDTGIDYLHPDLGGCFGTGCRVGFGYDFVGDAYDGSAQDPIIAPDPDPMDCYGHGTHVAGIVGAKGAVTGVAPGVTFGAYRVFGCSGTTSSDIMIEAMERALADGMQVVNMSIGSAFTWPQYPTAVAASRLVDRGIVVVASIGNSGANGLYSSGAPGVGDKVIGVASFDNTFVNGLSAFSVSGASKLFGYLPATAAPTPPTSGSFPMARTGTTSTAADACTALPAGSLAGKVVLIRRGTCSFNQKSFNAQSAGAAGVVLYNNTTGLLNPTVAGPPNITIPVVAVSNTDGALINALIASGPVTFSWSDQLTSVPNPTGGLISSFSSYGLSPDLTLKPDIGAPGGFIRSTYPRALGSYANMSGTSMASPHVAGAAALYLEANPRASAQSVRGVFQNNAVPKAWWGAPTAPYIDNVHRQGAGMLRIDQAVLATTRVDPAKLSLGESAAGASTQTLTLTNAGSSDVTYAVTHQPALATGPDTFVPSFFAEDASVTFSAASVTVPAGGSAAVTATIAANPALPDRSMYGGYVVFTPDDEGQTLRVPFAGLKGDYQAIQVLTPTTNGFPWLARVAGTSYVKQSDGAVFNLTPNVDGKADLPTVLVHLNHESRIFQMEVFDAATGRSFHRVFRDDYEVRNDTATGFFAIPWDGTTTIGAKNGLKTLVVPNGTYVLQLSVLKALGDESNPADWETWTSPAFTITR